MTNSADFEQPNFTLDAEEVTPTMPSVASALFSGGLRKYTMVIALVLLMLMFHWWTGGRMITPANLQNLITGNAHVLILAIGMLMVIIIGQIDLSVGSAAGLVGMVVAITARDLGVHWLIAVFVGILLGVLIGSWQGFWLAKMGIPGFITTLAGLMGFRGAVIWISHSVSVPAPPELAYFSSGYLPDWGRELTASWGLGAVNAQTGAPSGLNVVTLALGLIGILAIIYTTLRSRQRALKASGTADPMGAVVIRLVVLGLVIAFVSYLFASGRPSTGFPIIGVILVALILIYHVVTERTPFGRHIYAVGGNKAAAALTGVNVSRTYFFTMVNMSALAALAGVLFIGRASSAGPDLGTNWELDAIAAVFIGGAAVSGGIGTVAGTMIGGLVMATLNSGLFAAGVSSDKTAVIKGLVLLAAVAFDVMNKQQGRKSIIGHLMNSLSKPKDDDTASTSTTTVPPKDL